MKNDQSHALCWPQRRGKNPESKLLWWKKCCLHAKEFLGVGVGRCSAKLISFQAVSVWCHLPLQRPMSAGFVTVDMPLCLGFPHVE